MFQDGKKADPSRSARDDSYGRPRHAVHASLTPEPSRQAQPNDKPRPIPGIALRPDLSPECLHELPADCQPQPCPTVLARGRGADLTELVEDRLELVGGDAGAAVGDDALRPAVR